MDDIHDEIRQSRVDRRREDARLNESIDLMRDVRQLCIVLLIVLVVLGIGLGLIYDYMKGTRAEIRKTQVAAARVDDAFDTFTSQNGAFLDNHAKTQRLICGWYRANNVPVPEDCHDR